MPGAGTPTIPPALVYPIPGATGVPDGNFTLVAAYVPPGGTIALSSGAALAAAAVPSPLPSPYASPAPNATAMSGFAVGALAPSTSFTVALSVPGACPATVQLGQFTTHS